MRAAILREYDATPELGEFEEPSTGEGSVAAAVLAAGLNPVDLRKAAGAFPLAPKPQLPSVAGWEGVARLDDGRRVYFDRPVAPFGALAERTLLDPVEAFILPDGVDDGVAVALGIAGLAGWLALEWSAKLRPGETVLVLGASGTVGQVAVQAARLLGAAHIVAAGRDPELLERALSLGADEAVTLDGDLGEPTYVFDPLCGEPLERALAAAAPGARIVQLGQSAGPTATVPSAAVRGKQLELYGYSNFAVSPETLAEHYVRLVGHGLAGEIRLDIERVTLEELEGAWDRRGKVVVCL